MRKVLIAAVASSLATGAVIAAAGIAQSGDGTKKSGPPPTMAQALKDRQQQRDEHLARIAKRLGISADELEKAMDKVRADNLDQAVQSGRLTEAQRDAILACEKAPLTCDRSNLPAPRGGPLMFKRRGGADRHDFLTDLAKALDIDVAKVRAAFRAELPRMGPGRGHRGFGPGGPEGPPPGGPGGMPGAFVGPDGPPGAPA